MSECVATHVLHNPRLADGLLDCPLENRLVNMMPSFFTSLLVTFHRVSCGKAYCRRQSFGALVLRREEILAVQGVRQEDTAPPIGQIFFVNRFHLLQNDLERSVERL